MTTLFTKIIDGAIPGRFVWADDLVAHLIAVTKTIGLAQRAAWDAPRAAVLVAGFEIPHLHVHVLPAWDEASLTFANARHGVPGGELDAAGERLRSALRAAGHGVHVPAALGSPQL